VTRQVREHVVSLVREQREMAVPFGDAQPRVWNARRECAGDGDGDGVVLLAMEEDHRDADCARLERPRPEQESEILRDATAPLTKCFGEIGRHEIAERPPQRLPVGLAEQVTCRN
jgi:hypothetical protein